MMKPQTLFLITIIYLSSSITLADSSDLRSKNLRRLSLLLTSQPATHQDKEHLNGLPADEVGKFFSEKAKSYMGHKNFQKAFQSKMEALFLMKHSGLEPQYFRHEDNAFNNLIRDVLKNNLNWDKLLLSQEYTGSTYAKDFNNRNDLLFLQFVFYKELAPHMKNYVEKRRKNPSNFDQSINIPFYVLAKTPKQKQSLAGLVTTQRFFERFQTTKINKNRARAAALFRIFLCDPMKPVVLSNDKEDKDFLSRSLELKQAHTPSINLKAEARHGSDKQCQSCHYKLDPAANVFAGSSFILNSFAKEGALVYKARSGESVNIPVLGFQELALAITQQKEYSACQVGHFWNWVVGEDVPLNNKTLDELVDKFDELDRKPKDFISYLVSREEFSKPKLLKEDDVRYSHLHATFKSCDNCHSNEPLAPELSIKYPFGQTSEQNLKTLKSLVKAIDLHGNGAKATMPTANAGWMLQAQERDLIRAWIKGGGKDNNGNPKIEGTSFIDEISSSNYEQGFNTKFMPTFYNTYRRLLSGLMFTEHIKFLFPKAPTTSACSVVDRNTQPVVGFASPVTGRSLYKFVNPNYLKWWASCVQSMQTHILTHISNDLLKFTGPEVSSRYTQNSSLTWEDLTPEEKGKTFERTLDYILGKSLLTEPQLEKLKNRAFSRIDKDSQKQLTQAIYHISSTLLVSSTFLIY